MASWEELSWNSATIFGQEYSIIKPIGSGSFSQIFLGKHLHTPGIEAKFAIKREKVNTQGAQLHHEFEMYKILKWGPGIPAVYWFETLPDTYNVMIMGLLGPSLAELLKICGGRLTMKNVLLLANQLLKRLEYIHGKGILHRDIKPANLLMGLGSDASTLHLIDYGLAQRYYAGDPQDPPGRVKTFSGTLMFCSTYSHLSFEASRRDDLESAGYNLLYLMNGGLPWGCPVGKNRKEIKANILKSKLMIKEHCKDLPKEFSEYFEYCSGLAFHQTPDYSYLRNLFENMFKARGYKDELFDWNNDHANP